MTDPTHGERALAALLETAGWEDVGAREAIRIIAKGLSAMERRITPASEPETVKPPPNHRPHPWALPNSRSGAFNMLAGDRVVYEIDGRHGRADEFLSSGEAYVVFDDGEYATVNWNHLRKEPKEPKEPAAPSSPETVKWDHHKDGCGNGCYDPSGCTSLQQCARPGVSTPVQGETALQVGHAFLRRQGVSVMGRAMLTKDTPDGK